MLAPMTCPCLLACVPSGTCWSRPETRLSTSTQSPPAQMSSLPRTRIARSVCSPPDSPSGRPARRASSVSGRTPSPSTTTSAGYSASSVATPQARPCPSVRTSVTAAPSTVSMPSAHIASCTSRPMSGSRVDIGCSAFSSTVTA